MCVKPCAWDCKYTSFLFIANAVLYFLWDMMVKESEKYTLGLNFGLLWLSYNRKSRKKLSEKSIYNLQYKNILL